MVSGCCLATLLSQIQALEARAADLEDQAELLQSGDLVPDSIADSIAELKFSLWACRSRITLLETQVASALRSIQGLWDFVAPDGPSPLPPSDLQRAPPFLDQLD